MLARLIHSHEALQLLVLCTLLQLILARVPITPLPFAQFTNIFNLYPLSGNGGCGRNTPDGVPMLEHTLASLGGASAIAQTVAQDLPNYPTQLYIRGLLYLFFGITFQWNRQLDPDVDNLDAFNFISNTFASVNQVFSNPGTNLFRMKPRYRCLEDYATYYTHLANMYGQEDNSLPLVGAYFDSYTKGGFKRPPPYNDIWPGLMYVDNILDHTHGWYAPLPNDPPNGGCGGPNPQGFDKITMMTNVNFTNNERMSNVVQALFGITACPRHFNVPTLVDLGTPLLYGGPSEILKFQESADVEDLHELFHLVSSGVIMDQQAMVPPVADPLSTNDWLLYREIFDMWVPSAFIRAFGYFYSTFLGLARPLTARLNADSFAIFALCMYFPELNCLGYFDIYTKRSLPRGVLPRAVEKIRSGGFDLKRDLGLNQEVASSGEKEALDPGFGKKGKSRFKDVDRPSGMFG